MSEGFAADLVAVFVAVTVSPLADHEVLLGAVVAAVTDTFALLVLPEVSVAVAVMTWLPADSELTEYDQEVVPVAVEAGPVSNPTPTQLTGLVSLAAAPARTRGTTGEA